ncbi:hypothetical protein [Chryseobacterium sp. 18068]|uniref:hypothetical protein n=1 Tax=Chryseobacterium sp. 18068 TaxID=2681414 RepID=UPI00135AE3EE|nr:hypothetical protein [Chryseobacterium sp. 18068]
MEKLQSPRKILEDWRVDDFINKQYLCYDLRRCNTIPNHFILNYDINNYDWHAEQTSIKDNYENIIRLKTYLNKNTELVDLVQRQNEIEFDIDLNEKKLYFRLKYFFHRQANTEELRRNKAIVLETFSYDEFKNLVQYVGYGNFEKDSSYDYLGYFSKIYEFYFKQASTTEQLIFLYTNTPDFVFERMSLDDEKIMEHLIMLAEYDDTGFFSGWKDGSSAIVNALKAFSTNTYVLNRFKTEPELCNRIYYNLDGISFINGKPQLNRLIFANILMQYCLFSHNRPKENAPTFRVGEDYQIATSVTELSGEDLGFGRSNEKSFFLQQQQIYTSDEETEYETDEFGISIPINSQSRTKALTKGKEYFPLEMVYFINEDEKNFNPQTGEELPSIKMYVPAIYVKALADAKKWDDINYLIRITADIIAVVLGIVTLATTGNPYLILAAMADLSLAGIDLTVQALRHEIAKLQGGEQFLKEWDIIYGVGGAIVAGPQLIISVYKGIFILLPKAAKNVQQGLRTMAISLFLDLNSGRFERSQLKFLDTTEWVLPSCGSFDSNSAMWLENIGAGFIEIANESRKATKQEYLFIYKGLPVAKGNKYVKNYADLMRKVRQASYSQEKMVNVIDEALDDTWKYMDKEPASGGKYETKDLERIYKEGSKKDFERGVKYLNEKERESYEVFVQHDKIVDVKRNLVDTNGSNYISIDGDSIPTNMAIFVMSEEGKMYISKNYAYGKFHHSSFLAGKPISVAGEIYIEKGVIKEVTNDSGHYIPSLDFVKKNTLKELEARYYFNVENTKEKIIFKSNY